MTALATLPVVLGVGIHSARPAAGDVGSGGLYSCTTHGLVYQTDGSSWSTWATLGISSLNSASSVLTSGAVTLSQNSYTDIVSVSLAAGTWLVMAQTNITCSGSQDSTCRISDGSTHYSESSQSHAAGFDQSHFLAALVVLGSTTTVKLQGTHNAGGTVTANRNIPTNDAGNIATQINAIQVA